MREYIDLLLEKNEVMNLTAVRTATEAWERHVLDSLALLPILDEGLQELPGSHSIIDVGSGAGLPGLILALARPQWQVTLLDSLQKRCTFIEEVVETLEVGNVRVVWARAEKAGHDAQFREKFDGAVARAVAEMRVLTELSLPFVKVGGKFFAAKGAQPQEEVAAAQWAVQALGGQLERTTQVESYGPEGQRCAVVIKKIQATPGKYPRREGRPQKQPL